MTSLSEWLEKDNQEEVEEVPSIMMAPKPTGARKELKLTPSQEIQALAQASYQVFEKYFAKTGKCLCQDGGKKTKPCFCSVPAMLKNVAKALAERGA